MKHLLFMLIAFTGVYASSQGCNHVTASASPLNDAARAIRDFINASPDRYVAVETALKKALQNCINHGVSRAALQLESDGTFYGEQIIGHDFTAVVNPYNTILRAAVSGLTSPR